MRAAANVLRRKVIEKGERPAARDRIKLTLLKCQLFVVRARCLLRPVRRRGPGTMLEYIVSTLWEVSWRAPSRLVKYYYISPKRDDPSSGHFSSIPYLNTSNLEVLEHLQVGGVHTSNSEVLASP